MAFLTAKRIHNGYNWLPTGSVIEVSNDGVIISVGEEHAHKATFYDGFLCPGFVNTHCHLELSHMRGVVPEHTGLIPFLKTIPTHRNDHTPEQKRLARLNAYEELAGNGVVAVGDIANTTDTLDVRAMGKLHVHTFVEAIGFNEARAEAAMGYARQTLETFATQPIGISWLRQSITPHAPYSVSQRLFNSIGECNESGVLSIHNQESAEENRYFERKEGAVADLLHGLGIDDTSFVPSGKTSLTTYLHWLPQRLQYLFVHNTFTTAAEVAMAQQYCASAYWCLCPNANMYIENRLPDLDMLMQNTSNICIGTDSLASNKQLNILDELNTIKLQYPGIDWEILIKWATSGGAAALQMDELLGAIMPGKRPGIVQITNNKATGLPNIINRIV